MIIEGLMSVMQVWDLKTHKLKTKLVGHREGVTACAVTPDGKLVVSASHDRSLKVR
jgi:COMPASS component SWD3